MVACVHENFGPWTCAACEMQRHSPIGDVRVIKGRLKGLIFDQQSLLRGEMRMHLPQALFKPCFSLPYVCCSGIVRSIGEPRRDIATAEALRDFNAVFNMLHGTQA